MSQERVVTLLYAKTFPVKSRGGGGGLVLDGAGEGGAVAGELDPATGGLTEGPESHSNNRPMTSDGGAGGVTNDNKLPGIRTGAKSSLE